MLDTYEFDLRQFLSAERECDAEVEELRRLLAHQRLRVGELTSQLLEARSSASGGVRLVRGSGWICDGHLNVRKRRRQGTDTDISAHVSLEAFVVAPVSHS